MTKKKSKSKKSVKSVSKFTIKPHSHSHNPCGCEPNKNAFVGIAGTTGGISVAIVALVLIFASNQVWILAPVIGSLALMGIFLGLFHYLKK